MGELREQTFPKRDRIQAPKLQRENGKPIGETRNEEEKKNEDKTGILVSAASSHCVALPKKEVSVGKGDSHKN